MPRKANPPPLPISGVVSDRGGRKENEDASLVTPTDDGQLAPWGYLYAVADGMGGEVGGMRASRLAIDTLRDRYYQDPEPDIGQRLNNAIQAANHAVYTDGQANPALRGMGCTLTAAVFHGNHLFWAHVGDSRAYVVGRDKSVRLTRDHTFVAEAVSQGTITEEEARNHPRRHMITRAIGGDPQVEVDHAVMPLESGDKVLLCTDGLTNEVSDPELAEVVRQSAPQPAATELVAMANARGADDNITAIVVSVPRLPLLTAAAPPPADARAEAPKGPLGQFKQVGIVAIFTILVLAALTVVLKPRDEMIEQQEFEKTATAIQIALATGETVNNATVEAFRLTATRNAGYYAQTDEAETAKSETQTAAAVATETSAILARATAPPVLPSPDRGPVPGEANQPIVLMSPAEGEKVTGCIKFKWEDTRADRLTGQNYAVYVCQKEKAGPGCIPTEVVKHIAGTAEVWDPAKKAELEKLTDVNGQPGLYRWKVTATGTFLGSSVSWFVWEGGRCGEQEPPRQTDDDDGPPTPRPTTVPTQATGTDTGTG